MMPIYSYLFGHSRPHDATFKILHCVFDDGLRENINITVHTILVLSFAAILKNLILSIAECIISDDAQK